MWVNTYTHRARHNWLKNKPLKLMTVTVRATHRDRVRGVSKPLNLLVSKSSIPQDYYLSLESKIVQTPLGLVGIGINICHGIDISFIWLGNTLPKQIHINSYLVHAFCEIFLSSICCRNQISNKWLSDRHSRTADVNNGSSCQLPFRKKFLLLINDLELAQLGSWK